MKYADELRGSAGERCIVTDLRTGKRHTGVIVTWDDAEGKATVKYDSGQLIRVGFGFVELVEDEA